MQCLSLCSLLPAAMLSCMQASTAATDACIQQGYQQAYASVSCQLHTARNCKQERLTCRFEYEALGPWLGQLHACSC